MGVSFAGRTNNMAEGKQHVSIVICGHVDAGKTTTTGRLIFDSVVSQSVRWSN